MAFKALSAGNRGAVQARLVEGSPEDDDLVGTDENDTLRGYGGDDYIDGGVGLDVLDGGDGDDTLYGENLSGGAGNDHLVVSSAMGIAAGGAGDDTYYISADQFVYWDYGVEIDESAGGGTDTVITYGGSVNLSFNPQVENVVMAGVLKASAVGNALDNLITGNGAANVLDGAAGNDRLVGGRGNDTYGLDNPADVIVERAGQGNDTVRAAFTFTLTAVLENLVLTGSAAIDGTGTSAANRLTGNGAANRLTGRDGHDTLNGGGGLDTLIGGTGDDTYVLDSTTDVSGSLTYDTLAEGAGAGIDTVLVSSEIGRFTYVLDRNVENLTVLDDGTFRLWGNGLHNVLTGNNAGNLFDGFGGHDTLIGGTGADQFFFSKLGAGTSDVVQGFTHLVDRFVVSAAGFGGVLTEGGGVFLSTGPIPTPAFEGVPTFLYSTLTGQLSFDADGTDPGLAVLVAVLPDKPTLSVADFLIVA